VKGKTVEDWIRDNPIVLVHMLRAQVTASHVIVMQELREIQGRPFDLAEEVNRLSDQTAGLTMFFDMDYEREMVQKLKEKRTARRRQQMRSVSPAGA